MRIASISSQYRAGLSSQNNNVNFGRIIGANTRELLSQKDEDKIDFLDKLEGITIESDGNKVFVTKDNYRLPDWLKEDLQIEDNFWCLHSFLSKKVSKAKEALNPDQPRTEYIDPDAKIGKREPYLGSDSFPLD